MIGRAVCLCAIAGALAAPACTARVQSVQPIQSLAVLEARERAAARRAGPEEQAACPASAPREIVYFDYDTAEMAADRTALEKAIVWLTCRPETNAAISSQGDHHRSRDYQAELARRRAEAVQSYLVGRGIPPERIEVAAPLEPPSDTTRDVVSIEARGRGS